MLRVVGSSGSTDAWGPLFQPARYPPEGLGGLRRGRRGKGEEKVEIGGDSFFMSASRGVQEAKGFLGKGEGV